MAFDISPATPADAPAIASVHLAAFDSNPLLHVQFPSAAALQALREFIVQSTLKNLDDPGMAVLVVRDGEKVVGFASWELPVSGGSWGAGLEWPAGCNKKFLVEYYEKAAEVRKRVVGEKKCYVLSFVATLPDYQGQGIGTLLTQWGLTRAKAEGTPIYLDSTLPSSSVYRKLGFVALDGMAMTLPSQGEGGGPCIYEELGMLRTWDEDFGMDRWDSSMQIDSLKLDYEAGIKPQHVVQAVYDRIEAYKEVQPSVWIHIQPIGDAMRAANDLLVRWPDEAKRPPLWGIPFSVKDNFDIEGIPTTAGCPALAFTPKSSCPVYERCIEAGAIFIGKTNMEQLATGMTGCRSAYGTLHSTFSKSHVVGGSSSGSAVSVSEGLVSFSLGSDTAGSIRVPALYNGLVGLKPTKGTVSARGVAPACQHQDAVSFLALTTGDAEQVWQVCRGFDKGDFFAKFPPLPYFADSSRLTQRSSFRFGVPPDSALEVCSAPYRRMFQRAVGNLQRAGGKLVELEWEPFTEANELLYKGSFVVERLTIFPDGWFDQNKQLLHPVTREVFERAAARQSTAVDVFRDLHRQAACKRAVEGILNAGGDREQGLTVMVVPTTPFHPTIEEVGKDPLGINEQMGAFAHFANVLDLVGIALPSGTYGISEDERDRLPFGVTILASGGRDAELVELAKMVEEELAGA